MDYLFTFLFAFALGYAVACIMVTRKKSNHETDLIFKVAEQDQIICELENRLCKEKDYTREAILEARFYKKIAEKKTATPARAAAETTK